MNGNVTEQPTLCTYPCAEICHDLPDDSHYAINDHCVIWACMQYVRESCVRLLLTSESGTKAATDYKPAFNSKPRENKVGNNLISIFPRPKPSQIPESLISALD